jgi:hypothetical protein
VYLESPAQSGEAFLIHGKVAPLKSRQLRNVACYAPSFIKRQPFSGLGIALVGVTAHIGDTLLVGVNYLETPVCGFNSPWCWEAPHWQRKGASLSSPPIERMMP